MAYTLKKHMEVDEVDTTICKQGRLITEYIGYQYKRGDNLYIKFTHFFKIHGGSAIGINCTDKSETPARSIEVYGSDKEVEETKGLLKKLNIIEKNC